MTTSWRETLEQIRAQAARNCGLDHYPAAEIAKAEDCASLREDRALLWRNHLGRTDRAWRKDRTEKGTP